MLSPEHLALFLFFFIPVILVIITFFLKNNQKEQNRKLTERFTEKNALFMGTFPFYSGTSYFKIGKKYTLYFFNDKIEIENDSFNIQCVIKFSEIHNINIETKMNFQYLDIICYKTQAIFSQINNIRFIISGYDITAAQKFVTEFNKHPKNDTIKTILPDIKIVKTLKALKCTQCGADLKINSNTEHITCEYCGTTFNTANRQP